MDFMWTYHLLMEENWGMNGISPMSLGFAEEDLFFPTGHLSTSGNYRKNV